MKVVLNTIKQTNKHNLINNIEKKKFDIIGCLTSSGIGKCNLYFKNKFSNTEMMEEGNYWGNDFQLTLEMMEEGNYWGNDFQLTLEKLES